MVKVQIICRNYEEDRVVPRMARALRQVMGWPIGPSPDTTAGINYLLGYFEAPKAANWPNTLTAAYLTHREEEPPNNAKARLFDDVARRVDLRVVTCRQYYDLVAGFGPTMRARAPLERDKFVIVPKGRRSKAVVGYSGYTYGNGRKGEDLAKAVLASPLAERCEFEASGRGWPVHTKKYRWEEMAGFYQSLDVLVCTSLVEGIPMPPLEALACGVSVVIPRGVGMLDELPECAGIHRYERGNAEDLLRALAEALAVYHDADREELRAATDGHSLEAWVEDHKTAFDKLLSSGKSIAAMAPRIQEKVELPPLPVSENKRGIYVVAFGEPARKSARKLLGSISLYMPDVPVCLVGDEPLKAGESVFKPYADTDIGARRAKLAIDSLVPSEWQEILYLDADTVLTAPVYALFDWITSGWEFVICRDVYPRDNLGAMQQRYDAREVAETHALLKTWEILQLNGGVWSYKRNERTKAFFVRWQAEYEKYVQRDQGALLRALYRQPLKMLVLGNEWNTFPRYQNQQITAGILHYPQEARRWEGQIAGRIDSPEAWQAVSRYEGSHPNNGRGQ